MLEWVLVLILALWLVYKEIQLRATEYQVKLLRQLLEYQHETYEMQLNELRGLGGRPHDRV